MEDVKSIIEQLLPLLKKYNNGSITYQINQLNLALSLIDENEIDEKRIFEIIRGVFPPRGGLSDFNV